MAGQVRGSFDLNDRPAVQALDRVERAGAKADATLSQLGRTVDDVFSDRNLAEAKAYEEELGAVERQGRQTFGSLSRNAREAEFNVVGSIRRMDMSVALFRENLDSLSRERVTPKIDLDGVTQALSQIELVHSRLNALGREHASPSVGLPMGSTAARAVSGGGGGGGGRGGLSIPFAGSIPLPLVAGALAAAPPLLGGATGLLGSAGAAALGAGAVGTSAFGAGAVSGAVGLPVTIEAIKGMKEASKALGEYQKEVIKTGPNSKASTQALRAYNIALASAPGGTGRFLHARTQLGEEFRSATRPAQADIAGIGTRGVNLGRQLTPLAGELSGELLGSARPQANRFANFLQNPASRSFYTSMNQEASTDLHFIEGTAENVLSTMENVARAGRPFFHEGVEFLEEWTGGWKTSTSDLHDTRREIGGFVDQLKSWGHLGGAGFDLLRDLLSPAAGPGQSMVDDLTSQLETWDRWVQKNPRQVHQFFEDSAKGTERIAGALGKITGLLFKVGQQLTPLLEEGTQLVSMLSSTGLLSPGGLPILFAAGAGVRNARGAMRGSILGSSGTTTGGAPILLGGGGRTVAAEERMLMRSRLPAGSAYGLAREYGYSRVGATAAELGGTAAASRVGTFARGFAGSIGPYAAISFGLGALSTPGNTVERVRGGASQATLGLIAPPPTSEEKYAQGFQDAQHQFHHHLASRAASGRHILGGQHGQLYGNMVPAAAAEAGQSPDYFRYRYTHPSPLGLAVQRLRHADTGTPEGQGEAAFLRQQIERIKGSQGGRAAGFMEDIRGAAGVEMKHGMQGARATALGNITGRIGGIRDPRVAKLFGNQGLGLAREIERENPKLKGAVDELSTTIEKRFAAMGENVKIIHGRIVDTSAKSWGSVADLIDTDTQRAYASANKNLTALEKRAFAILRGMGFSPHTAMQITQQAQQGGEAGRLASQAASAGTATAQVNGHLDPHLQPGHGSTRHGATGMRIPGQGLHDTVSLGGGYMAAPGELQIGPNIANRHTERRVDRMLASYGTSLSREIGMEGRAHSEPFRYFNATGGRTGTSWRGIGPAGLHQGVRKVASSVLGQFPGLSVTSTTGGSHVSGSYHYLGEAVDIAGSTDIMRTASEWIKRSGLYRQLTEGIHNPNLAVSDGHIESGEGAYGGVWAEHANHIHLAVAHAVGQLLGGRGGGGGMGGRGGATPRINLKGRPSGAHGVFGAIADSANAMVAGGMSKRLNQLVGAKGGGRGGGGHVAGGSVSAQIARVLFGHGLNKVGAAGIIGNAYAESSLDPSAQGYGGGGLWGFTASPNSLSDLQAYAQSHHKPWTSAALQTQFLLQHVSGSLIRGLNAANSPEAAAALFMTEFERPGIPRQSVRESGARNAFSQGFGTGGRIPGFAGWYGRGGHFRVKNPTMIGVGDRPEDVHITPLGSRQAGGHTFKINVDLRGAAIHGPAGADHIGRKIGEGIMAELTDALESSDGVPESALTG